MHERQCCLGDGYRKATPHVWAKVPSERDSPACRQKARRDQFSKPHVAGWPAWRRSLWSGALGLLLILFGYLPAASAMDYVDIVQDGTTHKLWGRVVVEAADGGLLFLAQDGELWFIQPDEIKARMEDERPFQGLSQEEISERLLAELPDGFRIHTTANYVICYNTTQAYAQWIGSLYERLYRGFYTYWENQDIELTEPEVPLVVLVFDDFDSYRRHVVNELGTDPGSMIGYFHMISNQVTMYDLTGTQQGASGARIRNSGQVNQILRQPAAESMVATIVHEATHQLACNSGLQTRFSDTPFWVSEGLAIYFEAPDLESRRGWRGIGNVNRIRLQQMQAYLRHRPGDSLQTLITDDQRFRNGDEVLDAYAESWALIYFLMTRHKARFLDYLRIQAEKRPLVDASPEQRLAEFKSVFGDDLTELNREFLAYISRLRP